MFILVTYWQSRQLFLTLYLPLRHLAYQCKLTNQRVRPHDIEGAGLEASEACSTQFGDSAVTFVPEDAVPPIVGGTLCRDGINVVVETGVEYDYEHMCYCL